MPLEQYMQVYGSPSSGHREVSPSSGHREVTLHGRRGFLVNCSIDVMNIRWDPSTPGLVHMVDQPLIPPSSEHSSDTYRIQNPAFALEDGTQDRIFSTRRISTGAASSGSSAEETIRLIRLLEAEETISQIEAEADEAEDRSRQTVTNLRQNLSSSD